ncbi:2-succinyl-6-hydroxy-2, 4-cyclohexadiene-1-carboxylate synthase [Neolewinella maritima]|uniref:2-succinyl-6-hydroxy-2, 4-cyclohexadiene-1-carboxylate synthase n=1 Tax=Neolewinella maritima TaxID=1383882 RepID=A0ABN8F9W2_9BACT|nr:alpha/beta hydrolase [Neolewinella maritima]CAH1002365.1 2-succinyl-6-hydroxy-2, 4-cyclohexadiene-1-carboxylate synthase [Neolewinella maritima]
MRFIYLLFLPLFVTAQADSVRPLDARLSDYAYPYAVDTLRLESQQQPLEMLYMDERADQPNGKTVVLLHGKNFNGAYWATTMEWLIRFGYRVIVPDQIGFGKSSKPERYQYTFQQLADNTRQLLDHLGVDTTIVLGHSMGGMLAARFALMYPKQTEQLILVNPIGLEDWKLKVPYRTIDAWYAREMDKSYDSIRAYQQANYYDGQWEPAYDPWVNILAGWAQSEDYGLVAYNAALTYDMVFTQPVVYELPGLQVPTVFIIGTRDRTALGKDLVSNAVAETMGRYDRLGRTITDKIPGARLLELAGLGHLPHIEDFDRFAAALEQALSGD